MCESTINKKFLIYSVFVYNYFLNEIFNYFIQNYENYAIYYLVLWRIAKSTNISLLTSSDRPQYFTCILFSFIFSIGINRLDDWSLDLISLRYTRIYI